MLNFALRDSVPIVVPTSNKRTDFHVWLFVCETALVLQKGEKEDIPHVWKCVEPLNKIWAEVKIIREK